MRQRLHALYRSAKAFVTATFHVTQVFAVRLAILTLATPVFVLFTLVALVDGLVRRDLRRWGGGRESSFVYHYAKQSVLPLVAIAWVVYLALPFSVHPSLVVLPFAALFALSVSIMRGPSRSTCSGSGLYAGAGADAAGPSDPPRWRDMAMRGEARREGARRGPGMGGRTGGGSAFGSEVRAFARPPAGLNRAPGATGARCRERLPGPRAGRRGHPIQLRVSTRRERREDILRFARRFLAELAREHGEPPRTLHPGSEHALLSYAWPGNVRELKHCVERACIPSERSSILTPDAFFDKVDLAHGATYKLAYIHLFECKTRMRPSSRRA